MRLGRVLGGLVLLALVDLSRAIHVAPVDRSPRARSPLVILTREPDASRIDVQPTRALFEEVGRHRRLGEGLAENVDDSHFKGPTPSECLVPVGPRLL